MGRLRRIARRLAEGVARRLAHDELFEQPGERARQPPVGAAPLAAPAGTPAPAPAPEMVGGDAPCRIVDLVEVGDALGPGGGLRLVNHWATWCLGCVEEFDELKALVARLDDRVAVLGVSWDLFDPRGDEDDIREHVENFGVGHGLTWPTLLLGRTVRPADFFEAFGMDFDQIPQTWLLDDHGNVLHRVDGLIDAAAAEALLAAIPADAP